MEGGPSSNVHLWQAPPRFAGLHLAAVILGGLALDAAFGWPGQMAAIAWTAAVFAWLLRKGGREERRVLMLCMLIAGAGELAFSRLWGLYDYQFRNIPLFVPPGHALLMTLGLVASRRIPRRIWLLVPVAAGVFACGSLALGRDLFGVALSGIFLLFMAFGSARPLYATMFVLSLAMEIYGTALGNWAWRPQAPGLGLSVANPPFSAGAFYCLLDLMVLTALRWWPAKAAVRMGDGLAGVSLVGE